MTDIRCEICGMWLSQLQAAGPDAFVMYGYNVVGSHIHTWETTKRAANKPIQADVRDES